MGDLSAGDLPPSLDLEETSETHNEWPDIPSAERIDLVLRWLRKVEAATGMKAATYTRKG
jgi:hypothetical protein